MTLLISSPRADCSTASGPWKFSIMWVVITGNVSPVCVHVEKRYIKNKINNSMCWIWNLPHPFFLSGPMFMEPRRGMKCEPSITNATSLKKPLLQIIFQASPPRALRCVSSYSPDGKRLRAHLLQHKSSRSAPQINTEGDTYQTLTWRLAGARRCANTLRCLLNWLIP